jgi:hypothetical protein
MERIATLLAGCSLTCLVVIIAGCNRAPSGPPLVPAEGVVALDGKPLAAADVMFIPQGETPGQAAVARTGADGKFQLLSADRKQKGAAVGNYKVIVSKLVKPDGSDYVPDPSAGPIDTGGFRELLPAAYTDQLQTPLSADVPAGGTKTLEFKLNSKAR